MGIRQTLRGYPSGGAITAPTKLVRHIIADFPEGLHSFGRLRLVADLRVEVG